MQYVAVPHFVMTCFILHQLQNVTGNVAPFESDFYVITDAICNNLFQNVAEFIIAFKNCCKKCWVITKQSQPVLCFQYYLHTS